MGFKFFGKLAGNTNASSTLVATSSSNTTTPYVAALPGSKMRAYGEGDSSANLNRPLTALQENIEALAENKPDEKQISRIEAIINSMTVKERRNPDILNASRRRRIAAGAGMEVQDVNRLIKQYRETQKMMKMLQKTGPKGLGRLFG